MADDNFYVGTHEKTPVPAPKKRNVVPNKVKAVAKSTTASEVKRPKPRPLRRTYAVENLANEVCASHRGGESGDEADAVDQIDQHREKQKVIDHGSPAELIGGDTVDDSNAESDSGPPVKKTKVRNKEVEVKEKKAKKKKESIRDAIEAAQQEDYGNTKDNLSRKRPSHVDNMPVITWKGKGKPITGSNQNTDEHGHRWEKATR